MANKNTVTSGQVEAILAASEINTISLEKTTIVVCALPNGFIITESSSCVDPINYDEAIGNAICKDRIRNKIWELEGYKLQCDIYEEKLYQAGNE